MTDTTNAYITVNPGDLITAEFMNDVQKKIRQDIGTQVAAGVAGKHDIEHAGSADKLGTMTLPALEEYVKGLVDAQILKRTGYLRVFCNLKVGEDKIIEHGLKAYPIADLYQLDYSLAVSANSDVVADAEAQWALFYLYHASERRLRIPPHTDPIDIETDPKFRIPWKNLLSQFHADKLIDYTDDTTLDDLEVDFWRAMFRAPNDSFDPDASCHSPWFEKYCGERRTVAELKRHGDFDDIYLKIVPRKTINYAPPQGPVKDPVNPFDWYQAEPTKVRVSQLDPDTVALRLLEKVTYPEFAANAGTGPNPTPILPPPADHVNYLPVMLLLKA